MEFIYPQAKQNNRDTGKKSYLHKNLVQKKRSEYSKLFPSPSHIMTDFTHKNLPKQISHDTDQ